MTTDFVAALSHNSTLNKSEKVLALAQEFPFRTSRELATKVNPSVLDAEVIHKRLADLCKKGKVHKGAVRHCNVTGKLATVWWAPAPRSTSFQPTGGVA